MKIPVNDTTGFRKGDIIKIDKNIFTVKNVESNAKSLTVAPKKRITFEPKAFAIGIVIGTIITEIVILLIN